MAKINGKKIGMAVLHQIPKTYTVVDENGNEYEGECIGKCEKGYPKVKVPVSGGAKVVTKGGWSGTAVPNNETVTEDTSIYINTNLSIEEVVAIIESANLPYYDLTGQGAYGYNVAIWFYDDFIGSIIIAKLEEHQYGILSFSQGNISEVYFSSISNADFTAGWYDSAYNNFTVPNGVGILSDGYNSLLSSLFSTTPFVQEVGETKELSGEYDGSALSVEVSEDTEIDIGALIDEQKLPLSVGVKRLVNLQSKSVEPTDTEQTITADEGFDGLSSVTVGASSGGGSSVEGGYSVTFVANGETYAVSSVASGQGINPPTNPQLDGNLFVGWYTAETDGEQITFPYVPTSDITIYAQFSQNVVLGVTGLTDSSGYLTLTDDASGLGGYETATDGSYVSVTSQLDNMFPFNAIEEFTDSEGNVFVKYPKFWLKWETDENDVISGYKIANTQVDENYFIPDAFLNPSDTSGGSYLDYFALGKYEMSGSTSKGYSVSGATCLVSITRANARTASRAYGTAGQYYNGYQQLDFAQFTAYNLLCMLYYQQANIQNVYGGRTSYGTGSSWSEASVTGTCDSVNGLNGWNTSTDCVKMLGIENPYGNVYKWVDGVYFSSSTIYAHRYPQQFVDSTTNGISLGFARPTSDGWITAMKKGTATTTQSYVYASSASGGSASTYYGDYCYYLSSGKVLSVGGSWADGSHAGLFFLRGGGSSSLSSSSIGARLSYRPVG